VISLNGKRILVTKDRKSSEESLQSLISEGAELLFFPTIKIIPVLDSGELKLASKDFNGFDYIVFTSTNAVACFSEFALRNNLILNGIKVAVVGMSTAESCTRHNIPVDFLPEEFSAKGLLAMFSLIDVSGRKIFIPCSSLSQDLLETGLEMLGAEVQRAVIYNVSDNDLNGLTNEYQEIIRSKPEIFIFTSPSSFDSYCSIIGISNYEDYFAKCTICAIGQTTENTVRSHGLTVNIVPRVHSLTGTAEAIMRYFNLTTNLA